MYYTCVQNLATLSRSAGVKIENVSCDPDHAHLGVVCHPKARTWYTWYV